MTLRLIFPGSDLCKDLWLRKGWGLFRLLDGGFYAVAIEDLGGRPMTISLASVESVDHSMRPQHHRAASHIVEYRPKVKYYISESADSDRMCGGLLQNNYVYIKAVMLFAQQCYQLVRLLGVDTSKM